jgi:hypothetical protein
MPEFLDNAPREFMVDIDSEFDPPRSVRLRALADWPGNSRHATQKTFECSEVHDSIEKLPNGGVDAAARIQSSIAGPVLMRTTPPPLASNDLFDIYF